jgi:hypothetical protein
LALELPIFSLTTDHAGQSRVAIVVAESLHSSPCTQRLKKNRHRLSSKTTPRKFISMDPTKTDPAGARSADDVLIDRASSGERSELPRAKWVLSLNQVLRPGHFRARFLVESRFFSWPKTLQGITGREPSSRGVSVALYIEQQSHSVTRRSSCARPRPY